MRLEEGDGGNPLLLRGREQRDCATLAVADDGDALRIDVLPIRQHLHRRAHVFREVGERRRFGTAARLTDAALVVPENREPRVRDGAGELAENRDAGDELVAILRTAAADQHDRRQPPAHAFGPRQRAHEREAAAADLHLLVVGARNRHAPRRDRRDVLAHDVEALAGNRQAQQAAGRVAPDLAVERRVRDCEGDGGPARDDESRHRLNLFG